MYIHQEKKIAFIAHPRTASSATAHTLMAMGFEILHGHHDIDLPSDLEGWTVGCTVRNPFDTLVSWYHNKPRNNIFDLWLPIFLNGCHLFDNHLMFYGQPFATHVLQFETLQNDFDWFCADADLPITIIPPRNVSVRREDSSFMGHYNARTAKMVIERFRQDFINNNYPMRTP